MLYATVIYIYQFVEKTMYVSNKDIFYYNANKKIFVFLLKYT